MLCLEDCIGLSELDEEQVAAIAEHEHVPAIVAAEMGSELLKRNEGVAKLHAMVLDDIKSALERGRKDHASELVTTYRQLQSAHPLQTSSL
jgi:exo-beta-1,3-glucanase (GH17 family)